MADPDVVELTRSSMHATNDGDFDAAMAVFAEDAVFDVSEVGVGRFEGREAVRAYLADWIGSFERQGYRSWEGSHLGAGVVFVDAVFEALPVGSAAVVQERWAFTVVWRNGAIVNVTASQDLESARVEAIALAERAGA